jgi:hypothetical protein
MENVLKCDENQDRVAGSIYEMGQEGQTSCISGVLHHVDFSEVGSIFHIQDQ